MNLQEYVKPELLILIPVLYLIGMGIKQSRVPDRWIPLLLGAGGVLLSGLYTFAADAAAGGQVCAEQIFTAVTQGILCAGCSVYVNQLIRQAKKEENE